MSNDPLRRIAVFATLLIPLGLLHAFVLAEICIAITDILFVAAMLRTGDFSWTRHSWFRVAIIWWTWLVFCSIPGLFSTASFRMGLLEALLVLRLIVFTAALQHWVFTTPQSRRTAWLLLALSCLWIGVESWQQYATGSNIFGDHRFGDGALTGPFWKPRAGTIYAHLLIPAMLPVFMWLYAKGSLQYRAAALALVVLGVVTSVLIGQRIPTALAVLGLLTAAFFIPQLRRIAGVALAAALLFLLLTPIISPPTYGKLVGETSRQLAHFALSPYGELYTRATVMGLASPWHGWGFNGFRALCSLPQFGGGLPALRIVPTQLKLGACNLHPHNYYVQSLVDAGFPGLALFTLMMALWCRDLAAGLLHSADSLRVALLACFVTFAWPLASTDEFPVPYVLGWFFFALGLGLAMAHIPGRPLPKSSQSEPTHA